VFYAMNSEKNIAFKKKEKETPLNLTRGEKTKDPFLHEPHGEKGKWAAQRIPFRTGPRRTYPKKKS